MSKLSQPESATDKQSAKQSAKRASIIKGAIRAFELEGYEGASMDRVAELAGASKRTVYNYFSSKETLLVAVIADLVEGQAELKKIEYDSKMDLAIQISKFINAELYIVNDPTRLALARVLTSIFVRNPELSANACQGLEPPHKPFIQWLEAASDSGDLFVPDPPLAAKMFYGMIEGLFNYPALFQAAISKKQTTLLKNEIITLFLSRYRKET